MRIRQWARVAIVVLGVGSLARPALAQTVTWVTPPPATIGSGSQFTVSWQVSGFTGPFTMNDVAWGQTSLLGQVPGVDQGGGVYSATGTAPLIHGPLSIVVVVRTATNGEVLSPVQSVEVSAFQAIADLQATIASLTQYIEITTHNGQPTVRISGANVQIVDGSGDTAGATNGRGNLIIGYDSLTRPGGIMNKTGSHNLVVGERHTYASYGGVVGGEWNDVTGVYSSVVGGYKGVASGPYSSVSGGQENTASGQYASISGGGTNTASGWTSTVSGGVLNTSSFDFTSVTGGQQNTASSMTGASVTGGTLNTATGAWATVSGGNGNTASGNSASVTGGLDNLASGVQASVTGGRNNLASGAQASVTGGGHSNPSWGNTASGELSSVTGGELNRATSAQASVSGGRNNLAQGQSSSILGGFTAVTNGQWSTIAGGDGITNGGASTMFAEGTLNPPD